MLRCQEFFGAWVLTYLMHSQKLPIFLSFRFQHKCKNSIKRRDNTVSKKGLDKKAQPCFDMGDADYLTSISLRSLWYLPAFIRSI